MSGRSRKSSTPQKKEPSKKSEIVQVQQYRRVYKMHKSTWKAIRALQQTTTKCIAKLPFSRLIRELLMERSGATNIFRIESKALEALQEAAEIFLTDLFEDSNLLAQHCRRVTVMPKDMNLVLKLRQNLQPQ